MPQTSPLIKPVVVYDGECSFCQWSVRRVARLDRLAQFDVIPRQAPGLDERFPVLAQSDFSTGLRLLCIDGSVHVGADAVYQIYRRLPPFHLLAWLYRVPLLHHLFRAGYALIARYRFRVFGRADCDDGVCTLSFGDRASRPDQSCS